MVAGPLCAADPPETPDSPGLPDAATTAGVVPTPGLGGSVAADGRGAMTSADAATASSATMATRQETRRDAYGVRRPAPLGRVRLGGRSGLRHATGRSTPESCPPRRGSLQGRHGSPRVPRHRFCAPHDGRYPQRVIPERFQPIVDATAPLAERFEAAGYTLYLVGGSVRDAIVGRERPRTGG